MHTFRTATALCALASSSVVSAAPSVAPVVVTATRFETSVAAAPVNVTVIDAKAIGDSGANNLAELLKSQAGIHVFDLFGIGGNKTSADMGGFGPTGGQNTLILLNGRRLNDVDLAGANLAGIPLESIARVEVIHGSSAVLYGDNAVGGVINIVTRGGFDAGPDRVSLNAGSYDTHGLSAALNTQMGDQALQLSVDAQHSGGYRDNSAFDNAAINAEWTKMLGARLVGVRLNGNYEDLQLPGTLNEPLYETDPSAAGTGAAEYARQHGYDIEGFLDGETLKGELALHHKEQSSVVYGKTGSTLDTVSFTPRYTHSIGKHRLVTGVDLYHSELDTHADFGAPNINRSNTRRDSYGLYLSDTIQLSKTLSLDLGGRYQQVDLAVHNTNTSTTATSSADRNNGLGAWEAGLSLDHGNGGRSYLRLAQSFRFPVLDEIWSYFSGAITPLEPQRGQHLEIGTSMPLGNATRVDLDLFYMRLDNEIGFNVTTYQNVNFDPTLHQGANLRLRTTVNPTLTLNGGLSFRSATFRSGPNDGKHVPEIPQYRATMGADLKLSAQRHLHLEALYTGQRYFGDDFANAGKQMPAYTRLNLSLDQKLGPWSAQLQVKNLAGTKASDRGNYNSWTANPYYYYPLPERAFYLKLSRDL